MQPENQIEKSKSYELTGDPIYFYRPKEYSDKILKNHLWFILPSTVILLALPILFKEPILFLVALFVIPILALITFITVKTARGTRLAFSKQGLEFHEAVYDYSCDWSDLEELKIFRFGFKKIQGVKLSEPAWRNTQGWYEKLEFVGNILSIFSGTSSPSRGSVYAKGGKFIPVGLFIAGEKSYDNEIWQIIRKQAPWLFDREPVLEQK